MSKMRLSRAEAASRAARQRWIRAGSDPISFDRVVEAAIALADADTSAAADRDFDRALHRLRQAVKAWARVAMPGAQQARRQVG